MTVPIQTPFNRYNADSSSVAFNVNFYFQNTTDLYVCVDGVVQVLGVDYTVTGAGNPSGGVVTFTVIPRVPSKIDISLQPPASQLTDIVNFQTLMEAVLETAFDKLTLLYQYADERIGRALKRPRTSGTPVWNGEGYELTNIAKGTLSTSAARVDQIQGIVTTSGNVPSPLSGDTGKSLGATGAAAFSWQFPIGALLGIIEEQQSSGTGAGNGTATAWTTRVLNAKTYDRLSNITLSSNQFTLVAGDYEIEWESPGAPNDLFSSRLYNVTDSSVVAYGSSEKNTTNNVGKSRGVTRVSINGSKAFAIQYYIGSSVTNGLGLPVSSGGTEVYTRVTIRRA